MKHLLPLAAGALLLAGCSATRMDATASAVGGTVAHPVNAVVNGVAPLPQERQYTYWKKTPGTNLHEPYVTDHPLSAEEQKQLGIIPPDVTAPDPAK